MGRFGDSGIAHSLGEVWKAVAAQFDKSHSPACCDEEKGGDWSANFWAVAGSPFGVRRCESKAREPLFRAVPSRGKRVFKRSDSWFGCCWATVAECTSDVLVMDQQIEKGVEWAASWCAPVGLGRLA